MNAEAIEAVPHTEATIELSLADYQRVGQLGAAETLRREIEILRGYL